MLCVCSHRAYIDANAVERAVDHTIEALTIDHWPLGHHQWRSGFTIIEKHYDI